MTSAEQNPLYQELVLISQDFFGPATERFLRSQIEHHLRKTPDALAHADIPILAEWLRLSLALLHNDQREITRYIMAVRELEKR